jgi:CheY-like chemotaxis protein
MSSSKPEKILMVDDEPNVLEGYRRTLGRTYALTVALGGASAIAAIASSGPFAVVITDMRMPEMTGLEFIRAARPTAKESVFMMLTGNADQQTAVDAINCGNIFRFLNKPCSSEQLTKAIGAAVRQYELVITERVLLRETLTGSVRLMADALELTNPFLASVQSTVKKVHQNLCVELGVPRDWQMTVASSLCLVGLVTVPGLKKDEAVSDESLDLAATLGHRLLKNMPRLGPVAEMIRRQRELGSLPAELSSPTPQTTEIIGARLLRVCVDLARENRRSGSIPEAIKELTSSGAYDPRLMPALTLACAAEASAAGGIAQMLPVKELQPGMEADSDILSSEGILILPKGLALSELSIASLGNYVGRGLLAPMIKVRVPAVALKAA